MSEKKQRATAKSYLSREPVVNSYQMARLEEDESEVFLEGEDDISGVLIRNEGTITMRGGFDAVKNLLKENLGKGEDYRFHAVDPNSFRAAKKVLEIEDDRPTWLLRREYEDPREPEVEISPLNKDDAHIINEYWGLSGSDSTDYIKERIEKGPAYGVRREDELVGWCLTHFLTDEAMVLGMLHIKNDWRRKGFAKALTEKLCMRADEKDLVPAVQIFKDNDASTSLASDLGFEIRADHHWFDGKKK